MSDRVLLVDDDDELRELVASTLRARAYTVEALSGAAAALNCVADHDFDVVLTDIRMTGMSGIDLCSALHTSRPDLPVLVMTGHGDLDTAIAAIRAGAYDFITKPLLLEALVLAIQRATNYHRLHNDLRRLQHVVESSHQMEAMVGECTAIRRVYDLIERVAASDASVFIAGESGTGKELVARALHARSPRRNAPFIGINCAAMPLALLESELFGHVRGAFTDAKRARAGLFVQAQDGTLFLDEIGEMPLEMQSKLLRALQERKVRPVGADTEVPFDARLISSTNRDLETEIEERRFRSDLYYRINVVTILVPPLRARGTDILLLAQHCLNKQARKSGKAVDRISVQAARQLMEYDWPGNVRELENCIERAVAMAVFSEIGLDDLPDKIRQHRSTRLIIDTANQEDLLTLEEMERRYVHRALAAVGGNKSQAARVLGIDRRSLYRRLERLDKHK
ncbi:MAG: sigma-54-dependent Fis family transcriptional regulator [Myxococcales bacterium]|nr:sigma-54-dependent Fis family transcriptional regulator [Myxococcales bacterium]